MPEYMTRNGLTYKQVMKNGVDPLIRQIEEVGPQGWPRRGTGRWRCGDCMKIQPLPKDRLGRAMLSPDVHVCPNCGCLYVKIKPDQQRIWMQKNGYGVWRVTRDDYTPPPKPDPVHTLLDLLMGDE